MAVKSLMSRENPWEGSLPRGGEAPGSGFQAGPPYCPRFRWRTATPRPRTGEDGCAPGPFVVLREFISGCALRTINTAKKGRKIDKHRVSKL
jgi:hypothetical protein